MPRRNHCIFAFLCVSGPSGAAHATPGADAAAYLNFSGFRRSNFPGHGTALTGVVAATDLYAGIAAIIRRLPILPCKKFDSLLYIATYYRLRVRHTARFAGNQNQFAGTEPGFALGTSIRLRF